jgi:hypothetical protein
LVHEVQPGEIGSGHPSAETLLSELFAPQFNGHARTLLWDAALERLPNPARDGRYGVFTREHTVHSNIRREASQTTIIAHGEAGGIASNDIEAPAASNDVLRELLPSQTTNGNIRRKVVRDQ